MKKDSFTFSDKLKKSKTLPLSKRIPSRVGGDVKAKRTLFERAQRDLPFIIVAALALLLLPFLSRESGDIDTPSVVWGDGSDTYLEEFNQPKSAEGEIALSSFRNPLDLIIRHGDKEASARDAVDTPYSEDTYGSSSSDSASGSYSSRSSYGEEDYASSPATSKYNRSVKRTVRNSMNRVATPIGSLNRGGMVSVGGGSGVGQTMAIGSSPKNPAARSQGTGVRPVALQPLTAAGKGRDLTGGDALYAEAARSIGAFNRPGAKQALMEAQLKDVDGQPLGDTKGGPGAGDPNRPGAGGGPNNNWTHSNQKPWWWDMMKLRSEKRWELWHYNWEKMLSDNLIKWTSGLMSCLAVGSKDGDISKFLGADGGKADMKCIGYGGREVFIRQRQYNEMGGGSSSGKKKKGEEEKKEESSSDKKDWIDACREVGGEPVFKPEGEHKSFLDVRLQCLGIGLSDIKDKFETKTEASCEGINNTPMTISLEVKKNGKTKIRKLEKMGYYVVASKPRTGRIMDGNTTKEAHLKQCDTNRVIAIGKVPALGGEITIDNDKLLKKINKGITDENEMYEIKKVVVYKVGSKSKNSFNDLAEAEEDYDKMLTYTSEQQMAYDKKHGKNSYKNKMQELNEEYAKQTDLANGRTLDESSALYNSENYRKVADGHQAKSLKTAKDKGATEENDFYDQEEFSDVETLTISDDEYESAFALLHGRIENNECITEDFVRYTFKPWKGKLKQVRVCNANQKMLRVKMDNGAIGHPGEWNPCFDANAKLEAGEEYDFKARIVEPTRRALAFVFERYNSQAGYSSWKLVDTFDTKSEEIQLSSDKFLHFDESKKEYTGTVTVGIDGNKDVIGKNIDATPGEGRIVWIATDDVYGIPVHRFSSTTYIGDDISVSEIFKTTAPYKTNICSYSWGCNIIEGKELCDDTNYCVEKDGNNEQYYLATQIGTDWFKVREANPNNVTPRQIRGECAKICKNLEGLYKVLDKDGNPKPGELTEEDLVNVIKNPCPVCEGEEEEEPKYCYLKDANGEKCYESAMLNIYRIRTSVDPIENVDCDIPCKPICANLIDQGIFLSKPDSNGGVVAEGTKSIGTVDELKAILTQVPHDELCPVCNPTPTPKVLPVEEPKKCEIDFTDTFAHGKSDIMSNPTTFNLNISKAIDKLNDCIRNTRISQIDMQGHTDASTRGKTEANLVYIENGKCMQTKKIDGGSIVDLNPPVEIYDLLVPDYKIDGCNHCSSVENLRLGLKRAKFITKNLFEGIGGKPGIVASNPNIKFVVEILEDPQIGSITGPFGNDIPLQSQYNPDGTETITFTLIGYGSRCVGITSDCIRGKCGIQSNASKINMTPDRKVLLVPMEYNR